jgi:hypothetical protein
MEKYIIKGCGTIDEILTALKTMQAVFGKNATLEEVATATRYGRLTATVNRQLEEIERGQRK